MSTVGPLGGKKLAHGAAAAFVHDQAQIIVPRSGNIEDAKGVGWSAGLTVLDTEG